MIYFTVVHERFFTDTCAYADIILPATSSAESDDIFILMDTIQLRLVTKLFLRLVNRNLIGKLFRNLLSVWA